MILGHNLVLGKLDNLVSQQNFTQANFIDVIMFIVPEEEEVVNYLTLLRHITIKI
jgi:hypothetical protein